MIIWWSKSFGTSRSWSVRCAAILLALVLVGGAGGCAGVRGDVNALNEDELADAGDPLEIVNRQIFAANLAIDTFLLRPAAVAYRELMPAPGKTVVRNFVSNLKLPFTAINDLLQGEFERAETAFGRFLVNTVVGIGGLFDPATDLGLPYHREDFGQTLAVYGMEDGPYLVLPLLGPSNFRDAIGTGVEFVGDPVRIAANAADLDEEMLGVSVADGVDSRYRALGTIDGLRERSLDFYATVRSLYRQRRLNEIRNGEPSGLDTPATPTAISSAPAPALPVTVAEADATEAAGTETTGESPQAAAATPIADAAAEPAAISLVPTDEAAAESSQAAGATGEDVAIAAIPAAERAAIPAAPPTTAASAAAVSIAALPAPEAPVSAAGAETAAIEPPVPAATSSYAEALRAYEAASRAYEMAVRSSDASAGSDPKQTVQAQ